MLAGAADTRSSRLEATDTTVSSSSSRVMPPLLASGAASPVGVTGPRRGGISVSSSGGGAPGTGSVSVATVASSVIRVGIQGQQYLKTLVAMGRGPSTLEAARNREAIGL